MRILLVEDSKRLTGALRSGLRKLGHAVDIAADGETGLSYALHNPYDVVVLDIMLPRLDGFTVLRRLRESGSNVYVLVLTAKDAVDDRVFGLRQGADDYLVKPFAFAELVARIEALGRRRVETTPPLMRIGDLEIDTAARRVKRAGQVLRMTPREYSLLVFLASRKGQVVSRIEIEDHLYDERTFPESNVVQSAISLLRSRLALPGAAPLIHTCWGRGYMLDEEPP
ncbi:MAG: response regulator transcription factor [Planctomycetes bacterium]|nr:response regulator transcription factor [Planctomycetota bacterium]